MSGHIGETIPGHNAGGKPVNGHGALFKRSGWICDIDNMQTLFPSYDTGPRTVDGHPPHRWDIYENVQKTTVAETAHIFRPSHILAISFGPGPDPGDIVPVAISLIERNVCRQGDSLFSRECLRNPEALVWRLIPC